MQTRAIGYFQSLDQQHGVLRRRLSRSSRGLHLSFQNLLHEAKKIVLHPKQCAEVTNDRGQKRTMQDNT